jgi:tetratricopeptide (TPR) repeat protein
MTKAEKNIDALLIRYLCYLNLKKTAKAKADLKKLEQFEPNTSYLLIAKAGFAAFSGNKEEAINQIEKAVSMGFKNRYDIENEEIFKSLQENARLKQVLEKMK